jgi:hypothetical protein
MILGETHRTAPRAPETGDRSETLSAPRAEVAEAESTSKAITAEREERKFLLERRVLGTFLRAVAGELPQHRFVGEGANRLPDPEHFVTTVYFDTKTHAQLRLASENLLQNVKVRAREYYDLHASLAEVATDPSQIVHNQPWVWFEIKRRESGRTQKQRFRLHKREARGFFLGQHPAFEACPELQDVELASIVAYHRAMTEPLLPSCIVNYRRMPFQDESGSLRLTVDLDIGFYPAPAELWSDTRALVRGTFGAPALVERRALIEVKSRDRAPRWLEQLLTSVRAEETGFSKFVNAGRAVHGFR